MDAQKVSEYQMKLWQYLKNKAAFAELPSPHPVYNRHIEKMSIFNFANTAINTGTVSIAVKTNPDGSIELQKPVIKDESRYQQLINTLATTIYHINN